MRRRTKVSKKGPRVVSQVAIENPGEAESAPTPFSVEMLMAPGDYTLDSPTICLPAISPPPLFSCNPYLCGLWDLYKAGVPGACELATDAQRSVIILHSELRDLHCYYRPSTDLVEAIANELHEQVVHATKTGKHAEVLIEPFRLQQAEDYLYDSMLTLLGRLPPPHSEILKSWTPAYTNRCLAVAIRGLQEVVVPPPLPPDLPGTTKLQPAVH